MNYNCLLVEFDFYFDTRPKLIGSRTRERNGEKENKKKVKLLFNNRTKVEWLSQQLHEQKVLSAQLTNQ